MSPKALRALLQASVLSAMFLACQDTPSVIVEPVPQDPMDVWATKKRNTVRPLDERLPFRCNSDSGFAIREPVAIGDSLVRVRIHLSHPLNGDTLRMEYVSLSLRVFTMSYIQQDALPDLLYLGASSTPGDDLALRLLGDLDSMRRAAPASHSSATAPLDTQFADLRKTYATMLALGRSSYANFPQVAPTNFDTTGIRRAVLLAAVESGLPLAILASTWCLDINASQAHEIIVQMSKSGIQMDTTSIFPKPPIQATSALGLTNLVAGDSSARVHGSYAADQGIIGFNVAVLRDTSDFTNLFSISNSLDLSKQPKSLDLDGKVLVAARKETPPGQYFLRTTVVGIQGVQATSTAAFQVLPPLDHDGPKIFWISPTENTVKPFADSLLTVQVAGFDTSGVDSIWIDHSPALDSSGFWWLKKWRIPITGLGYPLWVVARDRRGNLDSAKYTILRQPPVVQGAPKLALVSPAANSFLPCEQVSIPILWSAKTDTGSVDFVWIQERPATRIDDSLWSLVVSLPPDGQLTTIPVRARNNAGFTATSYVQIGRKSDSTPPTIRRAVGATDATVPGDSSHIQFAWMVADNYKLSTVTLNGTTAQPDPTGKIEVRDSLKIGRNKYLITALDSFKNSASDSFVIFRQAFAPRHTVASGRYIGTIIDTISSPGSDSVQVSTDSIHWSTSAGSFKFETDGPHTLYTRAWPGSVNNSITVTISHIRSMALGPQTAAFIETDGSLWMSGDNTFGQLGDGTTKSPTGPERIMDGVATVSFGDRHTLILMTDKTLWVTGYNSVHQIGLGMQSKTDYPVQLMSDVELVAAGGEYSIIIKSDNSIWVAGVAPHLFQRETSYNDSVPKMVSHDPNGIVSIVTGRYQTFLLTNQGVLNAYGDKTNGVLGTGEGYGAVSTRVPPPSNVVAAALGEAFGLLVTSDGTLWSTGLGTPFLPPTWEERYVWTQSAMTNVNAIAAGSNFCLVLKTDGSLWRIGNGSDKTPSQIASEVVQITATGNSSMYLKTDGSLWRVGGIASTGGAARINF